VNRGVLTGDRDLVALGPMRTKAEKEGSHVSLFRALLAAGIVPQVLCSDRHSVLLLLWFEMDTPPFFLQLHLAAQAGNSRKEAMAHLGDGAGQTQRQASFDVGQGSRKRHRTIIRRLPILLKISRWQDYARLLGDMFTNSTAEAIHAILKKVSDLQTIQKEQ
jgi:hypothetical protein